MIQTQDEVVEKRTGTGDAWLRTSVKGVEPYVEPGESYRTGSPLLDIKPISVESEDAFGYFEMFAGAAGYVARAECILASASEGSTALSTENVSDPKSLSIWESPHIQSLLEQPVGAPIELTKEEALAIAREAFGSAPNLPPGEEYVRGIRSLWGSLIERSNG